MIARHGDFWKGQDFTDLSEFMNELIQEDFGSPADAHQQITCSCGSQQFAIQTSPVGGTCHWTCGACQRDGSLADCVEGIPSEVSVNLASSPARSKSTQESPFACPECHGSVFELDLATLNSEETSSELEWIFVGARCVTCGLLGSPIQWNVNDESETD